MTLMDAQAYDAGRARRRTAWISAVIILGLVLAWVAYHLRHHSERAAVNNFFAALQKQDYQTAYGIWFNDPEWKQHAIKHHDYSFFDFNRDWGTGGEWGLIKSYSVDCSLSPGNGSGVIVQISVNDRVQHAYVWVQKQDKTLSFSPNEIQCGNWWAWFTE